MGLRVVPGTASRLLAGAIATALRTEPVTCELERFPDGELRPVVDHVRGDDVYVVQPTGPPVSDHLIELFLLLDACRRSGAERITAVLPYFGYARQDRRGRAGEAVGARVVADALAGSGAQRLVVVDPHSTALEAMCGIPVEMLTAVPVLAGTLAPLVAEGAVVVAPDLGAVKLAEHYASLLRRPVAVVRKTRMTGATVRAEEIAGDVAGRPAVIVDELFYLLSADELTELFHHLGYAWDPRAIPETIEYYLARTSNGSTLSTLVHAWVLARANRESALELFVDALRSDVADVQGGTTAEGIHLAAMAGTVDVLQRCFAGVELHDDVLWLNPFWPKRLGTLEFSILYRGQMITLSIEDHTVRVASGQGRDPPVRIGYRGQVRQLSPGQTLQFSL